MDKECGYCGSKNTVIEFNEVIGTYDKVCMECDCRDRVNSLLAEDD